MLSGWSDDDDGDCQGWRFAKSSSNLHCHRIIERSPHSKTKEEIYRKVSFSSTSSGGEEKMKSRISRVLESDKTWCEGWWCAFKTDRWRCATNKPSNEWMCNRLITPKRIPWENILFDSKRNVAPKGFSSFLCTQLADTSRQAKGFDIKQIHCCYDFISKQTIDDVRAILIN